MSRLNIYFGFNLRSKEDQNKILLTFNAINLMRIFFLTCDKVFLIHNEFVTCYLRIGEKSYWERIELVICNENYTISYIYPGYIIAIDICGFI